MKKLLTAAMATILVFSLAACGSSNAPKATTLKGEADGYGGKIVAEVTKEGDKITKLTVTGADETPNIGGEAIKTLTAKITEAGTTEGIELVSGATVTSEAVIKAINEAK